MLIQKYDVNIKELTRGVKHKINSLIKHNCISKINNNTYKCRPIPNYNSSTYTILIFKNNHFTCSCQNGRYRKGVTCSHIHAVKRYINTELDKGQRGIDFNA